MAKKILVIKLGAFGDFIQALGPMAAIRRHHKGDHITVMTTKPFQNFALKSGYCDEVWLDNRPKLLDITNWVGLRQKLIGAEFDRVYDLQNNDRTTLYFKLFPKDKRPEWVGAAKGASHENDSLARTEGHAFEGHKQTLALGGISEVHIDQLQWMAADVSRYALPEKYALIVSGCAPHRPDKRWPKERFLEIARWLAAHNIAPVLIGTDAEAEVTSYLARLCPEAVDLTGQTDFFEIVSLARSAQCAVGNDTGPMHLIAATGCLAVTLYGQSAGSDPKRHATLGENATCLHGEDILAITVQNVQLVLKEKI